jgi:hypothetical protein
MMPIPPSYHFRDLDLAQERPPPDQRPPPLRHGITSFVAGMAGGAAMWALLAVVGA